MLAGIPVQVDHIPVVNRVPLSIFDSLVEFFKAHRLLDLVEAFVFAEFLVSVDEDDMEGFEDYQGDNVASEVQVHEVGQLGLVGI